MRKVIHSSCLHVVNSVLAALLLVVPAVAQKLPDIGKLMMQSRDREYINTGCPLCFDKRRDRERFYCCENGATDFVSWGPDAFDVSDPTRLACPEGGPCCLSFAQNETAYLDWLMPSYPLLSESFLLTWVPFTVDAPTWSLDWCRYAEGDAACVPAGANQFSVSGGGAALLRFDGLTSPFAPAWCPDDHVVLSVTRTDAGGAACVDGARWQFARATNPACVTTRTPTPTPVEAEPTTTPTPTATPGMVMDEGCYYGNGTTQEITTSFGRPELVLVRTVRSGSTDYVWYRTTSMDGRGSGGSDNLSCGNLETGPNVACRADRITGFTDAGFTVGTDPDVNEAGQKVCWAAFAGPGVETGRIIGTASGGGPTPQTVEISSGEGGSTWAPGMVAVQVAEFAGDSGSPCIRTSTRDTLTGSSCIEDCCQSMLPDGGNQNFHGNRLVDLLATGDGDAVNGFIVKGHTNWSGASHLFWWAFDATLGGVTYVDGYFEGEQDPAVTTAKDLEPPWAPHFAMIGEGNDADGQQCSGWTSLTVGQAVFVGDTFFTSHLMENNGTTSRDGGFRRLDGSTAELLVQNSAGSGEECNSNNIGLDGVGQYDWWAVRRAPQQGGAPTAAPDWSSSFIAVWDFEDSGALGANNGGSCGADCDLTNTSVTQNTTTFKQGAAAGEFNASTDELRCPGATCDELDLAGSGTWFAWARLSTDTDNKSMLRDGQLGTTGRSYLLGRAGGATDTFVCNVIQADTTVVAQLGDTNEFPINEWHFVACRFDDSSNTLSLYHDGTVHGTTASPTDMRSVAGDFTLGAETGGSHWLGQIDETGVTSVVLTDADLCRVCSCGVDGSACLCDGGDPTAYHFAGRNATDCQSCTLGPCDKAAPG